MTPKNQSRIEVKGSPIAVSQIQGEDYICLTDMARAFGAEKVVENWLRNKNTLEFLGVWEALNNPRFNSLEFEGIKNQAGLNRFTVSVRQWVEATSAEGLVAKTGRYGGTYAHRDIAFEFGAWLSPEFKLIVIKEFQRLKATEVHQQKWDSKRFLSKANYRLHTAAIKEVLEKLNVPPHQKGHVYANEADMLNELVFGQTAAEWRSQEGNIAASYENQRDYASLTQLVVLANLESLNSMLISQGKNQGERLQVLYAEGRRQYEALMKNGTLEQRLLEGGNE